MTTIDIEPTTATGRATALRLEGISKSFPGVKALSDVALEVSAGEVHAIVGENGAGKSTLMAITSGALKPDEGTVNIGGNLLTAADPEAAREYGVSIVRQEPALLPDLTVAENLYLAVTPDKRPNPNSLAPWAIAALERWGADLSIRASTRVDQLNPQQRFIVEICRALVQDPNVLILDEPTEHLLSDEVEVLFGHVRRLRDAGTAIVYISHRIPEVKAIADRITILRGGRTIATKPASSLSEDQIVELIIGRELDVFFPEKLPVVSEETVLRLSNYSSRGLDQLSLDVHRGEIIGLAGIEGNGQKDLLRALAGLEASRGSVDLGGKRLPRYDQAGAADNGIVYLTGDRHKEGVLSGLTVGENITFRSLKRLGRGGWLSARRTTDLARSVITDFAVKTPSTATPIESLSGGNQQKALLGGALVTGPRVFLVEEPTQGVDVGAKSEIYSLLRDAANSGAVVIVLSADALELAGISDRVLVFSRGQVIKELAADELSEAAITGAAVMSNTQRIRVISNRGRLTQWISGDFAPFAVVASLAVLVSLLSFVANERFLGAVNVSGILMLAAPLALVAFGQLFVLLTGGIDLSTGPLMSLVTVIASFYLIDGAPVGAQASGWLIILAVAAGVGAVNWIFVDIVKLSPIIATLITYIAVQAVANMLRPTRGGSISDSIMEPLRFAWGPLSIAFVVVAVIGIVLEYLLKRSRAGIALRAVGSRAEAARVNGLNPAVVRLSAYVACSLLAGGAGVLLLAQTGVGDASAGINYTLLGITAVVLGGASLFGGRGSFLGALAGAILINVVNAMTVFLQLSSDWQFYLVGAMTIGAVAMYSIARRRAAVSS